MFLVIAASCKEKPKPAATPAGSGSGSTGAIGSAGAPADAAAPSPVLDAAPTAVSEPGCEGWRASVVEHMGMGQTSVAVECAAGTITLTSTLEAAHDDDAERTTKPLTREAWVALWKQLDAANWRALPADCPEVVPPPESFSVTELELSISDGKTTRQLTCDGQNVTAAHEAIREVLDGAANGAR